MEMVGVGDHKALPGREGVEDHCEARALVLAVACRPTDIVVNIQAAISSSKDHKLVVTMDGLIKSLLADRRQLGIDNHQARQRCKTKRRMFCSCFGLCSGCDD